MMKTAVAAATISVARVEGYAGGSGTCNAVLSANNPSGMTDRGREQTDGGYVFSAVPSLDAGYQPGATYELTLQNPAKDINGFLAYAVSEGADASTADRQGVVSSSVGSKILSDSGCGTEKTVTHSDGGAKASVSFSWTAPAAGTGAVDVVGIAYSTTDSTFYSPKLNVKEEDSKATTTLLELVQQSGDHTKLRAAVEANAGVVDALSACEAATGCTLFAPTDAAFGDTDPTKVSAEQLAYHLIQGASIESSAAKGDSQFFATAAAKNLRIWKSENAVYVAGKGSVAAPTGKSMVTTADVMATNGILHVVDTVLTPVANVQTTATEFAATYSTLFTLYPDIATLLNTDETLTIFAPSSQAITANIAVLQQKTATELEDLLKYHMLPLALFSNDLADPDTRTSMTQLAGKELKITRDGNSITVNGVPVTASSDVYSSNGKGNIAIHFIDEFLDPNATPNPTANPTPPPTPLQGSASSPFPGFAAAAAAVLPFIF